MMLVIQLRTASIVIKEAHATIFPNFVITDTVYIMSFKKQTSKILDLCLNARVKITYNV